MALSSNHPIFNLKCKTPFVRPSLLSHCAMDSGSPFQVMVLVFCLLLSWISRKTHLQFSGEYGPFTSILSKLWLLLGRIPISIRKFIKSSHLPQIVIPLPPYKWYAIFLGLLQRDRISIQAEYSGRRFADRLPNPCIGFI